MHATPDAQVLKKAVLLACRAPSVHNSQPWLWVAEDGVLRLFVDRHRTVSGTDDSGREAIISCGAVLDHLRVAMLAGGWHAEIKRFPNPNDPDLLASIEFSAVDHVTDTQRNRADAILQRRTDRLPLSRPTYWDFFEPVLRSTIGDSLCHLTCSPMTCGRSWSRPHSSPKGFAATIVSYYARIRLVDLAVRMTEGVPASALASDKERRRVDVGREFPVRSHEDRRPEITWTGRKSLCCLPRKTPERTC